MADALHESGILQHVQVFGDRVARDPPAAGQLRDLQRRAVAQVGDETEPRRVAEGGEDVGRQYWKATLR